MRYHEDKLYHNGGLNLKMRCDERFTHAFSACGCVFKEITLVCSKQGNYFENATAFSKRMLKTTVATQLKCQKSYNTNKNVCRPNYYSPVLIATTTKH